MNTSFEGKRILVTGANRGIGRAIALRLSELKATVIGTTRSLQGDNDLSKVDPRIRMVVANLSDWEGTRKAVQSVLPIDMVVNNAGAAVTSPFLQMTEAQFDQTFDVNVRGLFNVTQVVVGDLVRRKVPGNIVNVSSQAGQAGLKEHSAYCASKGAVDMFTKALAVDLGSHNIRVNAVNPTVVLTDMGREHWAEPTKAKTMLDKIPLGRFAEVHEVVDAVVFLLSSHSSMINGVCLPIDGGFLAS